jgi:periplasmic protein TonB
MANPIFDKWTDPLSESRNELVFARRNREYGAYVLRRGYRKTMIMAMIISGVFFVLTAAAPKIVSSLGAKEQKKKKFRVDNIVLEAPKPLKDEPEPPPPPPPPQAEQPQVQTQKFVVPVINEQAQDPEPPPVQQEIQTNVGKEDKEGEKDNTQTMTTGPVSTGNEDNDKPLDVVQVQANFKGGINRFYQYVERTFVYPERCQSEGINGYVMLRFVVDIDGSISDVKAIETTADCPEFTKEAIRVLMASPKWTPAQNNGKPVKAYRKIPIKLEVSDE